ncbi:MAG TPA: RHS repeat-associated core domain-containing protein [Candidatus Saccharimonadales bacterium]|nr:RHS repeat-associated core domain-containing protein [Candidatus Saccharimonadales bacterium]
MIVGKGIAALSILEGANNVIQGNFIGTDATGMNALSLNNGSLTIGVLVGAITPASTNNLIGGPTASAHNVIAGMTSDGVQLNGLLTSNNVVQGNYLGVGADGVKAIGNAYSGVDCYGSISNLISGNIIGNNGSAGISGVYLYYSTNNLVISNSIYSNQVYGVNMIAGPNVISQNSIFDNGGLGIGNGGASSQTSNIPGQHHHFPIITNATSDGVMTMVAGVLTNDTPNTTFTLEFFNSPTADPSGFGEGKTFLGSTNIITDINGNAGFAATLPVSTPAGYVITATSTGPGSYPESSVFCEAFFDESANPCPPITVHAYEANGRVDIGPAPFQGIVGQRLALDFFVEGPSGDDITVTFSGEPPPGMEAAAIADDYSGICKETGTYKFTVNAVDNNYPSCPGTTVTFTFIITDPSLFPIISQASSQANTPFAGNDLHPISTFTGELYDFLPPDLHLSGPMPLTLQRYYAAFLKKDGLIAGALGDNWLHNFEMKLTVTSSNTVNLVNNLGRFIQFTNISGAFALTSQPDVPFQLTSNGSNYILGDPRSQMIYTFDSTGKLTTIADGHGNAQTLSYIGSQLASVTDGLGRTLTFQYGSSGFLTNVTDGVRSVAFTQTGNNLTSVADSIGFVTTYTYDTNNPIPGLMTAAAEPQGNFPYTQVFNASGQVISQTEAGANTTTINYSNLTTTLTDPLGNTRTDAHTELGELASFTDEIGQTILTGSDDHGRRNAIVDRLGNTTTLGYDAPSGKPSALTNADGTVTRFNYSARTNSGVVLYDLSQTIYPDGAMESFTYDASGNVLTRTDRASQMFFFSYNNRGQMLTATNPLGGVITATYDSAGRLASRMDTDTGLTTFQYDSLNRLTNVIHPDGATLQAAFDANDRLLTLKDERGNTTGFAYDQNNRLISTTDANLQVTHFAYDSRDRLVQATDRLGHSLGFSYDTLDHVATVTNRNGNVTTFTYDSRRRLASLTDPGGKIWSFGYDNEAIPASSTNPLGQKDSQRVNLLGYSVAFTNALGQVSSVARDSMERTTNAVDEISRTNSFGYETRGLLANTTAPLIGTATYQRNNLGLLSAITGLNGELWNFTYTPMGRLQSLADPLSRTNLYSYDDRGRLQRVVFADGIVRSNSYDPASNPTRRQYSGGPDLQFTYDSLNRLASANDLSFAYDPERRITNTVSSGVNQGAAYDADGRLTSVTYQNGAFTVNYAYDNRDRLTQASDTLTGTQINFNYDDAGRLTGITRPNGVNGTYTYDAAGRLTRIQEGSIIDIQYTVDAASQIVAANFTAPLDPATLLAPTLSAFAYDPAHQIINSGFAFDARGRQTASPGHSYQWDGASRLVGIDGVALAYNGANDLETRTTGGVTTRFFYNHALGLTPIMAERNESTLQIQRYYVWTPGGRLLYLIDATSGNAVRFFHFDRVGSTLALTSAAGAVTDAYAYSPYGVLLGHTGTSPQLFTYVGEFGVRSEAAANLYHMRARYYDPVSARFLTRDSVWPRLADNRTLDPYNYASESPILFIDPLGQLPSAMLSGIADEDILCNLERSGPHSIAGFTLAGDRPGIRQPALLIDGASTITGNFGHGVEIADPTFFYSGDFHTTSQGFNPGGTMFAGVPVLFPPITLPRSGAADTTDHSELVLSALYFNPVSLSIPQTGPGNSDPFGTGSQNGSCSLNYYGAGAPSPINAQPGVGIPLGAGAVSGESSDETCFARGFFGLPARYGVADFTSDPEDFKLAQPVGLAAIFNGQQHRYFWH